MKYKVGDFVDCRIANRADGKKCLSVDKEVKETKSFEIIMIDKVTSLYTVVIDDDMVGWTISDWHVKHAKVDNKFLRKRFYDINDNFIISITKK